MEGEREPWALRNARFIIVTGALAALVITGLSLFVLPTYWGAARIDDALKQPITTIDTSQNNASTSTTPPTTASVDKLVEIAKAKSEADNRVRELGLKVAAGIGAITAALVGWGRLELSRNEARLAESGHVT